MLEHLLQNNEIQSFLDDFPKHQWRKCIEGGILFGIRKIREKTSRLSYSDILAILGETQEDPIRLALQNMRKEIEEISDKVQTIEKQPKINNNLRISKIRTSNIELKPSKIESPGLSTSRSKQASFPLQQSYRAISKSSDRKIPKYLKGVQSKIKGDVQKDIEEYSRGETRPPNASDSAGRPRGDRELKEPNILPIDKAKYLKNEENEMFRIADEYLSNPFASYLTGGKY